MFEEIIFHVGAPKTGSTSIQNFLYSNHKLMLEHGVYTPDSYKNHQFLVSKFHSSPEQLDFNIYAKRDKEKSREWHEYFLDLALKKASECSRVLFTSEHLVLLSVEEIVLLYDYFEGLSKSLRVVLYVREPFGAHVSRLQESVKNGANTLESFICLDVPKGSFYQLIDRWAGVFGERNVHVRRLECENVIDDFLSVVGVPIDSVVGVPIDKVDEAQKKSNQSLSAQAVFIANELAKIAPKHSPNRAPQSNLVALLSAIQGDKFSFDISCKSNVYKVIDDDVRILNERYGFNYVSPKAVEGAGNRNLYNEVFYRSLALMINKFAKL